MARNTVLRFLPPFLLEEKHVDRGIKVLKKLLGKKRKKTQSEVSGEVSGIAATAT